MGGKSKQEIKKDRIVRTDAITVAYDQREAIKGLTTEYPYVMHLSDVSKYAMAWHWHEEVEFGYIVNGEVEIQLADRNYRLKKNQGYFMNGNVLAAMRCDQDEGTMITHIFHPVFLGGHFRSLFETKYMDPVIHNRNLDILILDESNDNQKKILRLLKQASYLQRDMDTEFQTRNIFSEIWLCLIREIEAQPVHEVNIRNQDRIQTMLSFIQQNYSERITLDDIAASASVSSRECIRCFRSTIKKAPMEYLTRFRLEKAKQLLINSDLSVTEISLQTGFSSNAYFGKVFRENFKVTPLKYRTMSKEVLH